MICLCVVLWGLPKPLEIRVGKQSVHLYEGNPIYISHTFVQFRQVIGQRLSLAQINPGKKHVDFFRSLHSTHQSTEIPRDTKRLTVFQGSLFIIG